MRARWIIAATLMLVVAAAGGAAAWDSRARGTARVAPALMRERLIARAEVVPAGGVAEVRARADGRVLRVLVREGDPVRAGQLLAEIESGSLEAEVQRRESERSALRATASAVAAPARIDERALVDAGVVAAREELSLARLHAERQERLHALGSSTEVELQAARTAAAVAAQRLRMAESRARTSRLGGRREEVLAARARADAAGSAVELARRDLDRTRVLSPLDGVVLARRVDPGDTVTAGVAAEPLFEVADPTRVELRAEVEELDAPRVTVGMTASLSLAGATASLGDGVVTRMSPRMERRRVGAEDVRVRADGVVRMAWITPAPGPSWVVGQRLDAQLSLAPRRAATTLPRSAVRVADGRALVRTPAIAGLWFEDRAVRLGAADALRVEVFGLSEGTEVALRAAASD